MPSSPPRFVVATLRAAGCVFAEDEARLLTATARTPAELAVLVDRRVGGEPLEHVLGRAEFCGLQVALDPGVFVPRRRTEFLVRQAAALVGPGAVVVDLCCGSGAVGAALARPGVEVHAADVDPAAVRCARRNLAAAGARVYEGDLYAPLPAALRGRVDVLVVNPPYVPTAAIGLLPAEARLHEPPVALDGGADGLDVQRRVAAAAPAWLAPGGHLLVETSADQASRTVAAVAGGGLTARVTSCAEVDATVVIGARSGGAVDRSRDQEHGPRPPQQRRPREPRALPEDLRHALGQSDTLLGGRRVEGSVADIVGPGIDEL
jgi:release factor glutamine methyltransferase